MKTNLLFSSFPFIDGEKVTLTRITDVNVDALWEIVSDDDNYRFLPTAAIDTRGEFARFCRGISTDFKERRKILLGIFLNSSLNSLCGIFEIFDIDGQTRSASVSFMLSRKYQGFGYASSALRAASDYLFNSIGVNRIQAQALPINYKAITVLERCGFVKEGTIREGFYWPDKGIVDLSIYSLLPTDRKRSNELPNKDKPRYYL